MVKSIVVGLAAVVLLALSASSTSADHGATGDVYSCPDGFFSYQAQAQAHSQSHPGDQDDLDPNNDGIACIESGLRCPCNYTPVDAAARYAARQALP